MFKRRRPRISTRAELKLYHAFSLCVQRQVTDLGGDTTKINWMTVSYCYSQKKSIADTVKAVLVEQKEEKANG